MNLEEEEKQMVGIDQAGQDCDLSGHCQDFFQCDSSIQNKICSQSPTRHLISMNITADMLLKYSHNLADYVSFINAMSDDLFFIAICYFLIAICYFFIAICYMSLPFVNSTLKLLQSFLLFSSYFGFVSHMPSLLWLCKFYFGNRWQKTLNF